MIVTDSNISIVCELNMVLSCMSIQFTIKMDVNSSLVSVFSAIYPITLVMINILNTASVETIDVIFSQLVFVFSKTQTKHNNNNNQRQLIMTQYVMLWQLSIYFKCLEANCIQIRSNTSSIREKLIEMSRIEHDNQNIRLQHFCFSYTQSKTQKTIYRKRNCYGCAVVV